MAGQDCSDVGPDGADADLAAPQQAPGALAGDRAAPVGPPLQAACSTGRWGHG
jgi:hypothetical protein